MRGLARFVVGITALWLASVPITSGLTASGRAGVDPNGDTPNTESRSRSEGDRAGSGATPWSIRPGDRIRIEVSGLGIEPFELPVPADGQVSIPGVGRFRCDTGSAEDLEARIRDSVATSGFVGSPGVTVNVAEYAPRHVYLLEGVRAPGAYALRPGTDLRLTQVLALGGGLAEGARRSDIRILRERGGGRLPSMVRFDLAEVTVGGRLENDIRIVPGDTIVIGDERTPDGWVWIGGAVRQPGRYPLLGGRPNTVLRAILTAGGFASGAEPAGVRVIRDADGRPETLRADLRAAIGKEPANDLPLRSGDVIIVPGGVF